MVSMPAPSLFQDKRSLYNLLYEIENLQIFALCNDFDELSLEDIAPSMEDKAPSLEDNTGPSSSSSSSTIQPYYSYRNTYHRFLDCRTHSLFSQSIIEQLRAPFIEIPPNLMDSSLVQSNKLLMALGFRFHPGQNDFISQEFLLPESFDRISFLCNSLGLSYNSRALSARAIFPYSCIGGGLRGLINDQLSNILVEVVTYYDGMYGRFLVLVCLGVGSTVWYSFAQGSPDHAPTEGMFAPIESYNPFYNMGYFAPGFRRIGFVERMDVSATVESAFGNEHPFAEITIPASGPLLKAVGLGVMIAFFLAVGLLPNTNSGINIQI